ncbi:prolipoprotein diacylglyceryl transferase [Patescibacteria group bacterium]|nr:prolipoprotein diacylglyceryl transferase [Patescibacteria group bacterium]MBP7841295.1 prolipoprotein diacylglyceryl transferase [Patescibacteria group bacterium]
MFAVGQYLLHRQKKTNTVKSGQIVGTFLLLYSTIRFLLEYLRQDSQAEFIAYFSKSQYFFIL